MNMNLDYQENLEELIDTFHQEAAELLEVIEEDLHLQKHQMVP